MFARILEMTVRPDRKEDIVNVVRAEILPILKCQPGFLEILPFVPEIPNEKLLAITLWNEKRDADRYEKETLRKIEDLLAPFIEFPVVVKPYVVETKLCEHLAQVLAA